MSAAKAGSKELRRKAETILTEKTARPPDLSAEDAIHELHVHQVELELQVEELRRAEAELQKMRDRYLYLYDSAPVGYVTLDRSNLITQANSAAAGILGVSKVYLRTRRFSGFLGGSWQSTFLQVSAESRRSGKPHTMEAQMAESNRPSAWVKLDIVADLETGELRITIADVTEQRIAEVELRQLAEGLIKLQEKERKSIAEVLHDDAGQQLTYLTILLDQARAMGTLDVGRIDQLSAVARKILEGIRALSASLSPAELSRVGLPGALKGMVSEFMTRTQIPVSFVSEGSFEGLQFEISLAVYRIVQESLTNAARHARPDSISLIVRRYSKRIFVQVEDDGKGFRVESVPMSLGLLCMRERARSAGGTLQVSSSVGKGTKVVFELRQHGV